MEEEIVHAYRHLKQICKDIKTHIGDFLDDDLCSEPVSEQSGSLEEVVIELRDLVRDTMDKDNQVSWILNHLRQTYGFRKYGIRFFSILMSIVKRQQRQKNQLSSIGDVYLQITNTFTIHVMN